MRNELKNSQGFGYVNYNAAARYALTNKDPKDALEWATAATNPQGVGTETFTTLMTLADAQKANNMEADAAKTREKAVGMGTPIELHVYARQLLQEGKQEAIAV
jgi:uncharacterized membrane-anchored protein